jgi:hypothetical protein
VGGHDKVRLRAIAAALLGSVEPHTPDIGPDPDWEEFALTQSVTGSRRDVLIP